MADIDPYYSYDCQSCGACCVSNYASHTYVHVSPADEARFTQEDRDEYLIPATHKNLSKKAMRARTTESGLARCSALRGKVGSCVSCKIYEQRPSVCRRFDAGSVECDLARRQVLGLSGR